MRKPIKNMGASVRARLLAFAKANDQPFDLILTRYTLERLLYRLSISDYRNRFILKGAMLLIAVLDDPFRPTRDLDLLGFGDSTPDGITAAFRDICSMVAGDAVVFDAAAITVDRIRDDNAYGGLRIGTYANVDGARVRVIIDIGFGDAIEPGPVTIELPVLLDQPAARLLAYPYEVVIAEKFQAMVALGLANTRLKDFYDIWFLSLVTDFSREKLARAIAATFDRRQTEIPTELPDALTPAFATDPSKQAQWKNFVRDVAHDPGTLGHVVNHLAGFLMPIAAAARALSSSKAR
jgi:predicted nucleotidyltransferase component of viral defense system